MTKQFTHQEYQALIAEIWHHNKLYYQESSPLISDQEYDKLFKKLEEIEKAHPEWIAENSPTLKVNETVSQGFQTIYHQTPMLSLANTYSKEEIVDFIKRIQKLTGKTDLTFSCELKMDGIAISVRYENGVFVRAATRGDGKKGDDITTNVRAIKSLPLNIYGNFPEILEIRGEVFMKLDAFKEMNLKREESGEELFANARNASAGSLKLLDSSEVAKRPLDIVFYGIAEESTASMKSQYEVHEFLNALKLPVLHQVAKCHSIEEIWEFIEKIRVLRKSLDFEIDGVVIKLDDLKEQKKLGSTGKNPRYAIAYKFAAEQAFTKILDITVQVGRTGVLTPVAELQPVFLAGSTISRATLHNQDEIERKDIRIGDIACIEKGGDVIPKVVSVNLDLRTSETKRWIMPENCPSCQTPIVRVEGESAFRCPNGLKCPEQKLKSMIHFVGKTAFDIEDLGDKVAEQLIAKGFIFYPSDIFILTKEQLFQLEGFKEKSVKNLLTSIEKAKTITLPKFIMALGIKHVGATTAELLAKKVGVVENLFSLTMNDLLSIEGVGEKVAASIEAYFNDEENKKEIMRLLANGVKPTTVEVISFTGHPFFEKTFVLTGNLNHYTRDNASSLIKERGGKVSSSVSKKTDFVLAGEAAGSKLQKAQELNVRILSESEFEQML